MPNIISDARVTRVDIVNRAAVRSTTDKSEPNRFIVFKAEGGAPQKGVNPFAKKGDENGPPHSHAKIGGGKAAEHEHPITGDGKGHKTPADQHEGMMPMPGPVTKHEEGEPTTDPATEPTPTASTEGDDMPDEPVTGTPAVPAPAPATDPAPVAAINKAELPEPVRIALQKAEDDARDARAQLVIVQKSADAAVATANGERDLRLTREYMAKAEELSHLAWSFPTPIAKADGSTPSKVEVLAGALRQLDELAPDAAAILTPMLGSANAAMSKSELFREVGIGSSQAQESSPHGRLSAIATEIAKAENCTFEQGYSRALDRNRDLGEAIRQPLPVVGGGGRSR